MTLPAWAPTLIGLVAAACTTSAFVPQLLHVWRRKTARDVSLATFVVLSFGTAVWLIYGVLIGSVPVAVANAATLGLVLCTLALKRRYDRAPSAPPLIGE
jgi:MtN3 and saliva related transmembrane protein